MLDDGRAIRVVVTVGAKLNLERLTLTPLLTDEDEFFFDVPGDRINGRDRPFDNPTPLFTLYPSNKNQLQNGVNPFAPEAFMGRWYRLPDVRAATPYDALECKTRTESVQPKS